MRLQINRWTAQSDAARGYINRLQEQIDALYSCRDIIDREISNMKYTKGSIENFSTGNWAGNVFDNNFNADARTQASNRAANYINSLNYIYDVLSDNITQLQDTQNDQWGLIGQLGNWINDRENDLAKAIHDGECG
jgi:hypothetical protein